MWLPTFFLEIFVFFVAVLNGLKLGQAIGRLPNLLKIILGLWLLTLTIATVQAGTFTDHAIRGAIFWIVHLLFFASVAHLFTKAGPMTYNTDLFLVLIPLAAAVSGLSIGVFVYFIGLDSEFNWVEHLPGFAHIRHTGYIFAPAIAISIAQLAVKSGKMNRLHYTLLAVNTALVLWLGSRGPVFGLLAGFAICTLVFPEFRIWKFIKTVITATGVGAILSIVVPAPKTGAFGALQRFWNGQVDPTAFSSGRTDFWLESITLIGERPLFGYGSHTYQLISNTANGFSKHPHQSLLQFVFDWGLIGGGLFLGLLGIMIFKAYFNNSSPIHIKITSAMVVSTLICFSLIDGIYFYAYTIALSILFVLWPIAVNQDNAGRAQQNN